MTDYTIYLITGLTIHFKGEYCRELETNNWHYWKDEYGKVYHFRKEHIVGCYGDSYESVLEKQKLKN